MVLLRPFTRSLQVAGLLIKPVQQALLGLFAKKASAVMTNVPGPAKPLSFCGSTVEQVMFWVPQSGDIGLGVSILTYAGKVQFGLIADKGLCPDPSRVIERFGREFESLVLTALMCPWGLEGDLDPQKVARALDHVASKTPAP